MPAAVFCALALVTGAAGGARAGEDTTPEAPPFRSEGDIPFSLDLACFRAAADRDSAAASSGAPARVDVEVYAAVSNDQLRFPDVEGDGPLQGKVRWEVRFRDEQGNEAFHADSELIPEAAERLDAADRSILQTIRERATLPPGRYRLEVQVTDLLGEKPGLLDRIRNKRNSGRVEAWVDVPALAGPPEGLSDLVFVRSARVAYEGDSWARGGVDFDPNPSRYFGLVLPAVRVFTEVYAGSAFQEGDTFLVQTQVLDASGLPLAERTSRVEPRAPVFGLTDELGLEKTVPAGSYRLAMTVVDERTRQTTRRESPFEVIWSVASWGREPDDVLQEMILVMTPAEYKTLEKLAPGAREVYLAEFWHGLDPDPSTADNPRLDDFRNRVAYADGEFGTGLRRGILTDRGRVYVRYGPPDDENYQFSSSNFGSVRGAVEPVAEPGERATLGARPSASFLDPDEFREGDVSDLVTQRGSATVKSQQLVVWTYDGRGVPLRPDHQDLTGHSNRGLKFVFADAMGNGDFQLIGSSGTTVR